MGIFEFLLGLGGVALALAWSPWAESKKKTTPLQVAPDKVPDDKPKAPKAMSDAELATELGTAKRAWLASQAPLQHARNEFQRTLSPEWLDRAKAAKEKDKQLWARYRSLEEEAKKRDWPL